jgi:hypothetical protein
VATVLRDCRMVPSFHARIACVGGLTRSGRLALQKEAP